MWVSEVGEDALLAHQLAVHHHGQVDVQDDVVVDGQTQHDANQCELTIILKRRRVEPEAVCLLRVDEHACVDTTYLLIVLLFVEIKQTTETHSVHVYTATSVVDSNMTYLWTYLDT